MKAKLVEFLHTLILYDYVLFAVVFLLFIIFIILGILLRKKLFFAVFFILLAFSILILGPTLGYIKLHEYLFKNSVVLLSQKKLVFTKAVIIKGRVTNESNRNFKICKITASAYSVTSNKLKNYLKKLKPFQKMSIMEYNILKGKSMEFKIIVEPFTYSRDYNISLGADCI